MKLGYRRILSGIVSTALIASLAVPAMAASTETPLRGNDKGTPANTTATVSPIVFVDVPSSYWSYSAISNMTKLGLFSGKEVYEDGTARFAPEAIMTRAEFITVAVGNTGRNTLALLHTGFENRLYFPTGISGVPLVEQASIKKGTQKQQKSSVYAV